MGGWVGFRVLWGLVQGTELLFIACLRRLVFPNSPFVFGVALYLKLDLYHEPKENALNPKP